MLDEAGKGRTSSVGDDVLASVKGFKVLWEFMRPEMWEPRLKEK